MSSLYEDEYGDYFIDGVHLAKGTTIYIKAKNSGCTGASLKIESYQAEDDWISTVLDFKNANSDEMGSRVGLTRRGRFSSGVISHSK